MKGLFHIYFPLSILFSFYPLPPSFCFAFLSLYFLST